MNCNEIAVHWAGVDDKTKETSNSPTGKPTMLFVTGNATHTNSGSDDFHLSAASTIRAGSS
jgi:hypothetical protein